MSKAVRRNLVSQYLLQLAKYVLPFVTLPYLTRVLGIEAFGVRAYTLSLMAILMMILDFGLVIYGTKRLSGTSRGSKVLSESVTDITALRIALVLVAAVPLAIMCVTQEILSGYATFAVLCFVGTIFKAIVPDFIFHAFQEMSIITYRFIVTQGLGTIAIFIFIRSKDDLALLALIELLAAFAALLWSWWRAIKDYRIRFMKPVVARVISTFRAGLPYFISVASTTLLSSFTGIALGFEASSADAIAYWSLAVTVIAAVTSLYTPITNSLYPHVLLTKDLTYVRKFLLFGMPLVVTGSTVVALFHGPIMSILGGEMYAEGSYVFILIAPLLALSYPVMLLGFPVLGAMNRVRQLTASSVSAAVLNISLLCVLLSLNQLTLFTAVIARTLSELLMLSIRLILVQRLLRRTRT